MSSTAPATFPHPAASGTRPASPTSPDGAPAPATDGSAAAPGSGGPAALQQLLAPLTAAIETTLAGRSPDAALADWLNAQHGPGSASYDALSRLCRAGVAEGWLCTREAGGIRYGRVFKPCAELHGHSVDVVDMCDVVGPHHLHPNGEIDLVMPVDADARFDGHGAGWVVMAPGSAHRPTVTQGRALVLYLLPQGQIVFS